MFRHFPDRDRESDEDTAGIELFGQSPQLIADLGERLRRAADDRQSLLDGVNAPHQGEEAFPAAVIATAELDRLWRKSLVRERGA